MVLIPSGSFVMGSPELELERSEAEGPQHIVTVPGFIMSRYPVTQAQWRTVAAMAAIDRFLEPNPSFFTGDDRPVEQVTWYEAMEFCNRISRHTGQIYRLPTEAEWEYACRAGTTTPFWFGQTITTDLANYCGKDRPIEKNLLSGSYGAGPKGVFRKETTPVGNFTFVNSFGLSDMHGNVLEWCLDHWHENYQEAPSDGRAWTTNDDAAMRVCRGGSWLDDPAKCRSAYRSKANPISPYKHIGFRVVYSSLDNIINHS